MKYLSNSGIKVVAYQIESYDLKQPNIIKVINGNPIPLWPDDIASIQEAARLVRNNLHGYWLVLFEGGEVNVWTDGSFKNSFTKLVNNI